jgi:outer membrane protein assembly factor BamD
MLHKSRLGVATALALTALLSGCGGGNPYQGLDAEALFRVAQNEYQEEDYENAIRALDRFLLAFGDSERVPQARLMLATAYFERGEFLTARSEFQRFLDRYAADPVAPQAALGICRSLYEMAPSAPRDQTYTQEAVAVCRNVVIDFGGTPEAIQASELGAELRETLAEKEYLNGDFYLRRKLYDSAIKYFEFVTTFYRDTDFAPMALLGIYQANLAIGYDDLAEAARERLLSLYPDSEAAAELRTNGSGS